jgi:hypothetical protein
MTAANPATNQVEVHQIDAIIVGMSIAAVSTRSCMPEIMQILRGLVSVS